MKTRLYFLLLLLFIFFTMSTTISYASFSSNLKDEILTNLGKLHDSNMITDNQYDTSYYWVNVTANNSSTVIYNYLFIIGKGNNNNYQPKLPTTNDLHIWLLPSGTTSIVNFSNDTSNSYYNDWKRNNVGGTGGGLSSRFTSTGTSATTTNLAFNNLIEPFYCYSTVSINTRVLTLDGYNEYGGSAIVYNGPTFTPSNNGSIEVIASNGVSENMTRLPFTYTGQNDWTLGYLSDFDDVYSIFGYFGPMFFRDGQLYTESYQNEFSYNYYYGTKNSGLIFDASTGRIAIKKEKLVNKQGYSLLLEYRLNNGDSLQDIGEYNYYAYYYNLSISSGDLISAEINSTVDIGVLNALDDFFNSSGDSDTFDYELNSNFGISPLFSGDFLSGDFLKNSGYVDYYQNDYSLFLYTIYENVVDIFLDTELHNETLEFDFRGRHFIFYASDFYIPPSPLKSFITLFLTAGYCLLMVAQYHYIFIAMNTLDLNGVVGAFDHDHSFFM